MAATKFTFKSNKETGRFAHFFPTEYSIKLEGAKVGFFTDKNLRIYLSVIKDDIMEDKNPNCIFKNITLAYKGKDIQECKDFLNRNFKAIISKYNLHKSK